MAEDPVEADAVIPEPIPEPPVADPPPHVPGQVSTPAQQGTSVAVPPAGGPNDTNVPNVHQVTAAIGGMAIGKAASSENSSGTSGTESQNSVRPSNYKTRLCMKWQQQGECAFGARCNFAHGAEEMRSHHQNNEAAGHHAQHHAQHHTPFHAQHNSRYHQPTKTVNENRKTRLCTKWHQYGVCPYAEKCNFAHGVHELKSPPSMMPADMNGSQGGPGPHPATARNNYKTRICLNWQNTGQCTYDLRCNFAHGAHELRGSGGGGGGGGGKGGKGHNNVHHHNQHHQQQQQQQQQQQYNQQMQNYSMMSMAQMPFHPAMHSGDMPGFQGPVVPMGAGMMPMGMPPAMAPPGMERFGQGGYMPQMHPVFSQVPPSMQMSSMMHPYPTPSPGPVAPPPHGSATHGLDHPHLQDMMAQLQQQGRPDQAQQAQQQAQQA